LTIRNFVNNASNSWSVSKGIGTIACEEKEECITSLLWLGIEAWLLGEVPKEDGVEIVWVVVDMSVEGAREDSDEEEGYISTFMSPPLTWVSGKF
jgi:hypothetical protein